ncbi:Uncharacterised protein [Bordetella ansorpii]|uniref:Uncharacterized protein n=1 Tax=Bordetella ansorpii TaxID=288768 RepID=A0A157MCJ1_9BORD|nr:hypothetical protein [Bordetella ansorpii]SAI06721.1 Uncharacterised protein [Bordetella ansorpii]
MTSSPRTAKAAAQPANRQKDKEGKPVPPRQGKVLPPAGPVTVPNQPEPVPKEHDEAAAQGRARADDKTESNWADGSAPQPRAKNARSSLF